MKQPPPRCPFTKPPVSLHCHCGGRRAVSDVPSAQVQASSLTPSCSGHQPRRHPRHFNGHTPCRSAPRPDSACKDMSSVSPIHRQMGGHTQSSCSLVVSAHISCICLNVSCFWKLQGLLLHGSEPLVLFCLPLITAANYCFYRYFLVIAGLTSREGFELVLSSADPQCLACPQHHHPSIFRRSQRPAAASWSSIQDEVTSLRLVRPTSVLGSISAWVRTLALPAADSPRRPHTTGSSVRLPFFE